MKQTLLLMAAAAATFMSAKAEVFTYDFETTPPFCEYIFSPDGLAFSGNYDFIDKTGSDINTDGNIFNVQDEGDGKWYAVTNRCISLEDGQTYALEADDEYDAIDPSHAFICWDQEGVGPSRTILMAGWNNTEEYEDKDYGAASAEDFVKGKNALGFLRNANTGARQGTYVQFPAVQDPTKVTVWIGNQGGSYHESGLYAEVTPVVDGEVLDPIPVGLLDGEYVAKRYYKFDVELPAGLKGNVAFRVGCGVREGETSGSQVQIYNVQIEGVALAGVGSIIDDVNVDGPVYNLFGVKVDDSYKGIVVKNGKKYVQK